MRVVLGMVFAGTLGCLIGPASAAPEAPGDGRKWHAAVPDTRSALPEVEPNDVCATGMAIQCGDVVDPASISGGSDVDWYRVTLTGGQIVIVATEAGMGGCTGVGDTFIELYHDCGATRVAYDDDGGADAYSLMTYIVPYGEGGEYEVMVRGYNSGSTGCYRLTVTCEQAWAPVNDACWGALPISRCTSGRLTGNSSLGLNDYNPTSAGCTGYPEFGRDVVYALDLQTNDTVDLSYTQTNDDAALYLITDCADVAGSCVIGADHTYSGQAEVIHWICPAAGLYELILDCWAGSSSNPTGGAWTLDFAVTCPEARASCCAPGESCTLSTESGCLAPNTWHPDWTVCEPNPCPASGASVIPSRTGSGILGLVPNPFTQTTVLWFGLSKPAQVRLTVFDAAGRSAGSFELGEMGPGVHTWEWNGRDAAGDPTAPGVYFARLSAGKEVSKRALVRIK